MNIIGIDPSIGCTGVAVLEAGKVKRCARIKPKKQTQLKGDITKIPTWKQIDQIIEALDLLHSETKDPIYSIEITSGKTARRVKNQNISGLGVYGMVVGQIVRWAIERVGPDRVLQFYENEWTGGGSKDARQEQCRLVHPFYAQHWYEQDKIKTHSGGSKKGGDVSDAIMIAEYAERHINIRSSIS